MQICEPDDSNRQRTHGCTGVTRALRCGSDRPALLCCCFVFAAPGWRSGFVVPPMDSIEAAVSLSLSRHARRSDADKALTQTSLPHGSLHRRSAEDGAAGDADTVAPDRCTFVGLMF